jgi:hypothetical protein
MGFAVILALPDPAQHIIHHRLPLHIMQQQMVGARIPVQLLFLRAHLGEERLHLVRR